MVSQGIVKGESIFSPSLVSVYRYAYMTGFSVTFSESACDRTCHSDFLDFRYTKIGNFFETSKLKFIENKQIKSIGTVDSFGCPLLLPLCCWLAVSPEMLILH